MNRIPSLTRALIAFLILPLQFLGCHSETPADQGPPPLPAMHSAVIDIPVSDRTVKFRAEGPIDAIDAFNGCFRIGGHWYWTDVETEFELANCGGTCGLEDLYVGDYAKLVYRVASFGHATRYAQDVEVEEIEESEPDDSEIEGAVSEIRVASMQLRVATQWYWADDATQIDFDDCEGGDFDSIQVGDLVKIEYQTPANDLGYYSMEIEVLTSCEVN